MVAKGKFILLKSVGLTSENLQNMHIFIQTVMCPGTEGEDYAKTRIQIYDKLRVKSSLGLLPDKHSSQKHLKRSNLQAYIWKQCLIQDIDYPTPEDNGSQLTDDGRGVARNLLRRGQKQVPGAQPGGGLGVMPPEAGDKC